MFTKSTIASIFIIAVLALGAIACGDSTPVPLATQEPSATESGPAPSTPPSPTAPIESTPSPTDTPEPETVTPLFDVGPCSITRAAQLPIEFEYTGSVPTGFDGINQATCTFTKPVATVTVVLTGPATHTETFTLDEPSVEVAFPLPEGTLSITTQEIVPPGEYQREITVTSVDGETLVVSSQPGVLKTMTILEPLVEPLVFGVDLCITNNDAGRSATH